MSRSALGRSGCTSTPFGASTSGLAPALPRNADSPVPTITSDRPDTVWFTRNDTASNPWTHASSAPATPPARSESVRLPVCTPVQNPTTAPSSIIPSTPRFITPDRSAISSPRAASRIGVPATIALAADSTTTVSFIPQPPAPRRRRSAGPGSVADRRRCRVEGPSPALRSAPSSRRPAAPGAPG